MSPSHAEQSFTLSVSTTDLDFLRKKLDLVRFPDELADSGREYGAPLADICRLVARWRDGFDWRAVEAKINKLPQFTRDIDVDGFGALNIHYIHKKSEAVDAIPLLFIHGWPGHFLEVSKILPLLTSSTEEHPSFHVVAFSLPGFGFSEAPKKAGFSGAKYAEVGNQLMLALGYGQYVVQGGDWGYPIGQQMAHLYGHKHVKAWHTNFPIPILYLKYLVTPYTAKELEGLKRIAWWKQAGQGYFAIQHTKPQTVGYSLADSPIGLLAWIYEKLIDWTDGYAWDDDETGPAAAGRIYAEFSEADAPWTSVPLGISYFPKELMAVPKLWSRTIGKVVFESEHNSGGHFAAYEKPEELVEDLRAMFRKNSDLNLL